jgi:hypothetical protein
MRITAEEVMPLTLREIYHYCLERSFLGVCVVTPKTFWEITQRFLPEYRPPDDATRFPLFPWHEDGGEAVILEKQGED